MALTTKRADAAPDGVRSAKAPKLTRGRMPNKTSINFATIGVKRTRWWLVVLAAILIAAAAFAIGKFLVYDRLMEVYAAETEATRAHTELQECYGRIASYGELNDLYAHYTYSGMTKEELARVDRVDVLELLENVIFPRTEVFDWTLRGNTLTLKIEGKTLQEINETVQQLLAQDIVDYCEVNTAATDTLASRDLLVDPDKVTADIVVYLVKPEEVAEK